MSITSFIQCIPCMFDHSRIINIKTKLNFFATKTQRIFAHNQLNKVFYLLFSDEIFSSAELGVSLMLITFGFSLIKIFFSNCYFSIYIIDKAIFTWMKQEWERPVSRNDQASLGWDSPKSDITVLSSESLFLGFSKEDLLIFL